MKHSISLLSSVAALFLSWTSLASAENNVVTFEDLVKQTIARETLCEYPVPVYACKQASSYDRGSVAPNQPNWFANNDAKNFIRVEKNPAADNREEWVMMDVQGAGAIVRFWIAGGQFTSNIYIYIDGAAEPAISGKIDEIVGGKLLVDGEFSQVTATGRNLYLPIPFAKSIKVTVDKAMEQPSLYYQINYRLYEESTQVESFSMEKLNSAKALVEKTQSEFYKHENNFSPVLPKGCYRIDAFQVRVESKDIVSSLRNTVVKMTFDGVETVWAPLGDFFGSGVGVNPYKTIFTLVEGSNDANVAEMVCYWRMPYRESAVVEFETLAGSKPDIRACFAVSEYVWKENSMYFHADWRQERGIQTVGGNGTKDWNYNTISGKGVFVGDCLSLVNRVNDWWGEGDEHIYVDGETFPSHFGTGTEDYYGYSWGKPEYFQSPWRAQPRAEGPASFGNVTNMRFRSLDAIPFTKSFKFDIEIWHWKATTVDYAVTTFWYGAPGAQSVSLPDLKTRMEEAAAPVEYKTRVRLDFDSFSLVNQPTGGNAVVQNMEVFPLGKWKNDKQLWWSKNKPGDQIDLEYDLKQENASTLVLGLTQAVDYAVVEFFCDGKKIGGFYDLYVPREQGVRHQFVEIPLEKDQATVGKHTITVRIVGKTRDSLDTMFGIDEIQTK